MMSILDVCLLEVRFDVVEDALPISAISNFGCDDPISIALLFSRWDFLLVPNIAEQQIGGTINHTE
jgi:hypothetical protein